MLNLLDIDAIRKIKEVRVHNIIEIESILNENLIPSACTQSVPQKLTFEMYGFDELKNININIVYIKWNAQILFVNLLIVTSFDVNKGDKISKDITNGININIGIESIVFIMFSSYTFSYFLIQNYCVSDNY